jgi:hypothetical protein
MVCGALDASMRCEGKIAFGDARALEPIPRDVEPSETVVINCRARIKLHWRPMRRHEHHVAANHRGLGYPNDLTDAEWVLVGPRGAARSSSHEAFPTHHPSAGSFDG